MKWKIADQSSQSSGGSRVVQMAVDCDAEGQIRVYEVATLSNDYETMFEAVPPAIYGEPTRVNAVKYLAFDSGGAASAGVAQSANGNQKNRGTHPSAIKTRTAAVSVYFWEDHTPHIPKQVKLIRLEKPVLPLGGQKYNRVSCKLVRLCSYIAAGAVPGRSNSQAAEPSFCQPAEGFDGDLRRQSLNGCRWLGATGTRRF